MGARDYSSTSAANLSVGGVSVAEGWQPASVNNAIREELKDVADLLLDLGGATETTGSATAYLLALDSAPTAYANNLFFLATSHITNTGAATLNLNTIGVKSIEKIVAGTAEDITAGDFPEGHIGVFTYSTANNSIVLVNPATEAQAFVSGVAALRARAPANGRSIILAYHTTPGDLGGGMFYGVTGDAAGTHVDDDGTVIVPTGGDGSAAWLRVWDGITAHVGWFGARCTPDDVVHDDYDAVHNCLKLFTDGRTSTGRSGVMEVGPGFTFGKPLIYGGNTSTNFIIRGSQSRARGAAVVSVLRYIGPPTYLGAITFYGANESEIENINPTPGNANSSFCFLADNTYSTTLTLDVPASTGAVLTVGTVTGLQLGCYLGIDVGGDNFEIVYVIQIGINTVRVAELLKDHAAGAPVGGSAPSHACNVNRCRPLAPIPAFYTTLSIDSSAGSGVSSRTFTPASMAGIAMGDPVRVGRFSLSETVYVTAITGTTFDAVSNYQHFAGDRVTQCTAAVLIGNRMLTTVQVSEIKFWDCAFTSVTLPASYAGVRVIRGGNVKNFVFHHAQFYHLEYGYAGEETNGPVTFFQVTTAGLTDTIFLFQSGNLFVTGLEDESAAYILRSTGGGSNPVTATFVSSGYFGQSPQGSVGSAEIVNFNGALSFINCTLRNGYSGFMMPPVIAVPGITSNAQTGSLSLIGCHLYFVDLTSDFVRSSYYPNAYTDVMLAGTGKLTMLGCTGSTPGTFTPPIALPSLIPPHSRWQNTDTIDFGSRSAGTCSAVQTMTVSGAVLGDLVEISHSLDLQGCQLTAWVSAANTVSYMLNNPTTGTIDLGSGTIKCRVKK